MRHLIMAVLTAVGALTAAPVIAQTRVVDPSGFFTYERPAGWQEQRGGTNGEITVTILKEPMGCQIASFPVTESQGYGQARLNGGEVNLQNTLGLYLGEAAESFKMDRLPDRRVDGVRIQSASFVSDDADRPGFYRLAVILQPGRTTRIFCGAAVHLFDAIGLNLPEAWRFMESVVPVR